MLSPIEWRMECLKLAANTSQKQDEILAAAKSFVGFVMEVQERSDLTAVSPPLADISAFVSETHHMAKKRRKR